MALKNALIAFFLACGSAQAEMSLSDQINAVSAAQANERARQEAIQRAAAEQAAQLAAQQRTSQLAADHDRSVAQRAAHLQAVAAEQQRAAAQQAARQEEMAAQQAMRDEAMADKKRNQAYEDQLRALQIEQAKLQLLDQQQKVLSDKQRDQAYEDQLRAFEIQQRALDLKKTEARVARENDFIDHDLKHQDATTDVIQSGADATWNLSKGAKVPTSDPDAAALQKEANQ